MQLIKYLIRSVLTLIDIYRGVTAAYSPPNPRYRDDVKWVKSVMIFYHFDHEKISYLLSHSYPSLGKIRCTMLETVVKELKDIPNFGGRIALKCETPDFRIRVLGIRVPVVSKLRTLSK